MISKDIFFRLIEVCEVKTLKELSKMYGHNDNWATNARKREAIPFDICAKVAIEKNVSLDYLIFGVSNEIDMNRLKSSVTEGLFSAIETNMFTLNKDVKITNVIDILTSEIASSCNINQD